MIPFGASLRGYSARAVSDETASAGGGEMITQQHFTDEVDINTIVRRFGLTGVFPGVVTAGVYGDFSGISDYESAVGTIARTQERFMRLPADLREKFENDPGQLIAYASSHSEEELAALFAPRPEAGPPVVVPPVVDKPPEVSAG